MTMKMLGIQTIFQDVMLCYLVDIYTTDLEVGLSAASSTLKMKAAGISLTVLPSQPASQPTTQRHMPQNHNHSLSSRSSLFWDNVSCGVVETLYVLPSSSGLQARRFHQNSNVYVPNNMASHNTRV
jgi:hypothetical protein